MRELILHIGTLKTGTISLQSFLFENREALRRMGVSFPVFAPQLNLGYKRNGLFLRLLVTAQQAGTELSQALSEPKEGLELLSSAFDDCDRVLLSDEALATEISPIRGYFEEKRVWYWDGLGSVAKTLMGADCIRVVVYVRRQDEFIASRWKEMCKGGYATRSIESEASESPVLAHIDYAKMLDDITCGLSPHVEVKVVPRRFSREAFEGGDIYHDFLAAADIPWSSGFSVPGKELNQSLSFDAAEALRGLNDVPPDGRVRYAIVQRASELSRLEPDPANTTPFSAEAAQKIASLCREGNEILSKRCFDGEPLFSEGSDAANIWVPNQERIQRYREEFERVRRQVEREESAGPAAKAVLKLGRKLKGLARRLLG